MLEVNVIHVGNMKESFYKEALAEYKKRLSAYCTFTETEIKEAYLPESPSKLQIEAALAKEGAQILAKIPQRAFVAALCVEGKQISSEELAQLTEKAASEAGKLVFIIGSSYGLAPEVKSAANTRLSFSKMTFPHRLMRVMLSEQIYRAFTINAGKTYHK